MSLSPLSQRNMRPSDDPRDIAQRVGKIAPDHAYGQEHGRDAYRVKERRQIGLCVERVFARQADEFRVPWEPVVRRLGIL